MRYTFLDFVFFVGIALCTILSFVLVIFLIHTVFADYHTVSTRKLLDSNITSVSSSVYHKKGCEEKCIYLLMEGNISCKCMTTEEMKEYLDSNK